MFANFTSIALASVNPFSKSMEMVSCGQAFSDFKEMFEVIESEDNGSEETIVDVISEMKKLCSGTESEKTETGTEANAGGDLFKSRILAVEEVETLSTDTSVLVDEDGRFDIRKAGDAASEFTIQGGPVSDPVAEEIRHYLNPHMSSGSQEQEHGKVLAGTGSSGKNWEIKETGTEEAPAILINIQAAAESTNVNQATETPMQHALRNAKRGKK